MFEPTDFDRILRVPFMVLVSFHFAINILFTKIDQEAFQPGSKRRSSVNGLTEFEKKVIIIKNHPSEVFKMRTNALGQ